MTAQQLCRPLTFFVVALKLICISRVHYSRLDAKERRRKEEARRKRVEEAEQKRRQAEEDAAAFAKMREMMLNKDKK